MVFDQLPAQLFILVHDCLDYLCMGLTGEKILFHLVFFS